MDFKKLDKLEELLKNFKAKLLGANTEPGKKLQAVGSRAIAIKEMAQQEPKMDWNKLIPKDKSKKEKFTLNKGGQWILEKATIINAKVPKGSCDCGAHKIGSHAHSDWCSGLKPPKVASPHQGMADELNNHTKAKFHSKDVGSGWSVGDRTDPDLEQNMSDIFEQHGKLQPDDVMMHYDWHTDDLPHTPGDMSDYNDHMEEQHQAMHDHMNDHDYELVDTADGSGGGLDYGAHLYRKRKKV